MNVEEESAGDEIEESHISLEDTEDAGNKHGEEFANVEEDFSFPGWLQKSKTPASRNNWSKRSQGFPLKYARLSRDLFFWLHFCNESN